MNRPAAPPSLPDLLDRCVACGLCLPHCATYLATGNEVQSPRGRFQILGAVAAGELAADDPAVASACDQCLGCLACTSVCPGGIEPELVDRVRQVGRTAAGPRPQWPLGWLDRPALLRTLRATAALARGMLRRALGPHWRRRLAGLPRPWPALGRLLGTVPADPGRDEELVRWLDDLVVRRGGEASPADHPGTDPRDGPRVAWFAGCADASLVPRSQERLRGLLQALGCRLEVPAGQVCCGAQAAHRGDGRRAEAMQRRNLAALTPPAGTADLVAVGAAGCGHHLRGYPEPLSGRVMDTTALLARLLQTPAGPVPLRVALHDPCHARHGQGLVAEPRAVLASIPELTLLEAPDPEVCCGAAGTYGLRHAGLSAAMGERKAASLAATGCDLVVTTSTGCLGQLTHALALGDPPVPVVLLGDLVWYAWRRRTIRKDPA